MLTQFQNEVLLDCCIQSLVRFGLPHNLLQTDLPRTQPQLVGHRVLSGGAGPAPWRWVALQHWGEAEVLQQVLYLGAQRHFGLGCIWSSNGSNEALMVLNSSPMVPTVTDTLVQVRVYHCAVSLQSDWVLVFIYSLESSPSVIRVFLSLNTEYYTLLNCYTLLLMKSDSFFNASSNLFKCSSTGSTIVQICIV